MPHSSIDVEVGNNNEIGNITIGDQAGENVVKPSVHAGAHSTVITVGQLTVEGLRNGGDE